MAYDEDDDAPRGFLAGRRAVLAGGVVVVASAALGLRHVLGGGPSGLPQAGGELVVAFDGTASTRFAFDPQNSGFAPYNRVTRAIFDGLVVLHPDQTLHPWLAEAWDISPDGTTYTFTLRKGVTFHDGTAFDAAALMANLDRLANPNAKPLYSRSSLGPYERSEIIAPDKLRVILAEPFTPLLRNLSSTKLAIVSPAAVAKYGAAFAQNPVGTGAFRFVGMTAGTEIRLERNPDYRWAPDTALHPGPSRLDKLTFRNVPVEATRVAVLQSGQAQVADLIPPQNLPSIQSDPAFRVLRKELLETNYALSFNVSRAPWDDIDIRRAIRLSLDVDTLVKVIYLGQFKRAWSSLTPTMFGSAESELTGSWKPDPAQANAILDGKGWKRGADGIREKDGKRLDLAFLDTQGNREKRLDVIQLARRQLAATGIGLHVDSQPAGAYLEKIQAADYDVTGGASFHADPDILRIYYDPEARSALSGTRFNDPEIVDWLRQAARTPDGPARAALYRKAQHKIIDQVYAVPIYVLDYNLAVSKTVGGVAIDAHGFPDFHGAWLSA
jgi:peptide/nickel transport system substrate-binding protein